MNRLTKYFLRGLLVFVPVMLTIIPIVWVITRLDNLFERIFGFSIPGLGLVAAVVIIWTIGLLASNFVGRMFFDLVGKVFTKVPLVKLLYSSMKDLVEAFAGEKKKFERPVLATLIPGSSAKVVGFATSEDLESLGLSDHIAVYLPQSYNFAGNVLLFPRESVQALDINSSEAMTFIVSGGVVTIKGRP